MNSKFIASLRSCLALVLALYATLGAGDAAAQSAADKYPEKSIKIVIPFPPGGSTDALGRAIAQKMQEKWGQSVVVENRPGASTLIGSAAVAKAAPDEPFEHRHRRLESFRIQQPYRQGAHGHEPHQDRHRQQQRGLDLLFGNLPGLGLVFGGGDARIEVRTVGAENDPGHRAGDDEGCLEESGVRQAGLEVASMATEDENAEEVNRDCRDDVADLQSHA